MNKKNASVTRANLLAARMPSGAGPPLYGMQARPA